MYNEFLYNRRHKILYIGKDGNLYYTRDLLTKANEMYDTTYITYKGNNRNEYRHNSLLCYHNKEYQYYIDLVDYNKKLKRKR